MIRDQIYILGRSPRLLHRERTGGEPESLWGEQKEAPEESRVVTGTGSHK